MTSLLRCHTARAAQLVGHHAGAHAPGLIFIDATIIVAKQVADPANLRMAHDGDELQPKLAKDASDDASVIDVTVEPGACVDNHVVTRAAGPAESA